MKKPSEDKKDFRELRNKVVGLGSGSARKSYYPSLRKEMARLERFQDLLSKVREAICLLEVPSLCCIYKNETSKNILKSHPDKNSLVDFLSKERLQQISKWLEMKSSFNKGLEFEIKFENEEGSNSFYSISLSHVKQKSKDYLVSIGSDITEHKKFENSLRESENRYRSLIEQSNDAILLYDYKRIIHVNKKFIDMYGYSFHELVDEGFDLYKLASPKSHDMLNERWQLQKEGIDIPNRLEYYALTQSGKSFEAEVNWTEVKIGDKNIIQVMIRDVSERRKLEKQVQQAIKMEAVGRLAGGIAHDFNNLLTAIIGSAELAKLHVDEDNPLWKDLDDIVRTTEKAGNLSRKLLNFSRKQFVERRILNLNEVISNMEKMLKRIIGEDIRIEFQMQEDIENVYADSSQVEQIIVNLAVNARDAMPQGGKLTIETKITEFDDYFLTRLSDIQAGTYVLLTVSDNGSGMSEEVKNHIFEPFYSTKEEGKGTGLGLATVYAIVKQSNGYIDVYSELNKGTTFNIYLPSVKSGKDIINGEEQNKNDYSGDETVLVIEDNLGVQNLVNRTLTSHGYKTIIATTSSEARKIFEESGNEIDIIVSDIILPDQSGPQLLEYLRNQKKEIKVLFMSGHAEKAITDHGFVNTEVDFIQKPFRPNAFLEKLREVLEK